MSRTTSQTINALQSELSDLRAVLAAIDKVQAIIEFDLDGTIRTANENFLKTVGYSAGGDPGPSSQHVRGAGVSSERASTGSSGRELAAGRFQAA